MKRIGVLLTSLTILFTFYLSSISKKYEGIKVKKFSLRNVRLLENSVFYRAQELNKKILLSYNPDRLLAKFRKEVGLEPKAEHYGYVRRDSILEIYIDDFKLAEKVIKGSDSVSFDYFEYLIPDELTKGRKSIRIKFSTRKNETTPRILDVRIMKFGK